MRILFIGNSHTYCNNLPYHVAEKFREKDIPCEVTMLAGANFHLSQHIAEPQVRFNILYGNYDYVVLQEYSQPFVAEEEYVSSFCTLDRWIEEAGSRPVLFMAWAKENDEPAQSIITQAHFRLAEKTGALLAPAGELWWPYLHSHPEIHMYGRDGEHASGEGTDFAAGIIFDTIYEDYRKGET